jgi:MYXO-CTERM domain-containing protein
MSAETVLAYATGGAAAIAWRDDGAGSRGIITGSPIEMIADEQTRSPLLAAAFTSFGIEPDPDPPIDPDDETDTAASGCGCAGSDGSSPFSAVLLLGVVFALRRSRRRGVSA